MNDNPYQAPTPDAQFNVPPQLDPEFKQRHGCLTAWLILMLIGNSIGALANLAMSDQIKAQLPSMPDWALPVLALLGAVNIACAIGLFMWKKWGFFGFVVTSVVAGAINIMAGVPPAQTVGGFLGIAILFGVLQIGQPSGWSQLE